MLVVPTAFSRRAVEILSSKVPKVMSPEKSDFEDLLRARSR